jgi:hypothetical protein
MHLFLIYFHDVHDVEALFRNYMGDTAVQSHV